MSRGEAEVAVFYQPSYAVPSTGLRSDGCFRLAGAAERGARTTGGQGLHGQDECYRSLQALAACGDRGRKSAAPARRKHTGRVRVR